MIPLQYYNNQFIFLMFLKKILNGFNFQFSKSLNFKFKIGINTCILYKAMSAFIVHGMGSKRK